MSLQYVGLHEVNGPLIFLDHVLDASYEEMVEIKCSDGTTRLGKVVQLEGDKAAIQVFEGTNGLSLKNTRTKFTGRPMEDVYKRQVSSHFQRAIGRASGKSLAIIFEET